MRRMTVVMMAVAVALAANAASAQKKAKPQKKRVQRIQLVPGQAVFSRSIGRNSLYLLRNPKVQTELKLDDDQKKEVNEAIQSLSKKRREETTKLRGLPAQQRVQKSRELTKQFNKDSAKKVKEILEPKQAVRLEQIQLQMQGIQAFHTPALQKKLKITYEQKSKFEEVRKATAVARQKTLKDLRANGRIDLKKFREATQKLQEKQEKDMHAVLTKEQREQFEKMKGKKFDLPRRGGVRLFGAAGGIRIQGVPGGKIQIRRVKRKNVKPTKKENKEKKEGGK